MNTVLICVNFQNESGASSLMNEVTEGFNVYLTHSADAGTAVYHKDGTVTLAFLKTSGSRGGERSLFWNSLTRDTFPGKEVQGLPPAHSQLPGLHLDTLFLQEVEKELQPGTSSLMLIMDDDWSQRAIKELQDYNGSVHYTPLSSEDSALFPVQDE